MYFGLTLDMSRSISVRGLRNLPTKKAQKLKKFINACKADSRQLDIWVEGKKTETLGTITLGRDLKSPFVWFDNIRCNIKDLLDNYDKAIKDLESAFLLPHERKTLEVKTGKPLSRKYKVFRKVPD